jgi:hypothetical protein
MIRRRRKLDLILVMIVLLIMIVLLMIFIVVVVLLVAIDLSRCRTPRLVRDRRLLTVFVSSIRSLRTRTTINFATKAAMMMIHPSPLQIMPRRYILPKLFAMIGTTLLLDRLCCRGS